MYFISASELFVDTPESGTADRIPVHIDISVSGIACQCKREVVIYLFFEMVI